MTKGAFQFIVGLAMLLALGVLPCAAAFNFVDFDLSSGGVAAGVCEKCYHGVCMNSTKAVGVLCSLYGCPGSSCGMALTNSATFMISIDHTIQGRVVDEDEDPVANVTVKIELATGQMLTTTTGSDGTWSLTLDTPSEESETLDVGDAVYDPSADVYVVVWMCPSEGYCE